MTPDINEIKALTKLPDRKIMNIYLFGSRIYGTCHEYSDIDAIVVANSLDREREIREDNYNIHVHTPDKFRDDLRKLKMVNVECICAPQFAILQERIDYSNDFILRDSFLRKKIFSQSQNSWAKAKRKLRENDLERALKSLFHSLRILIFGKQLLDNGKIIDFSAANKYWDEIKDLEEYRWNLYKEQFLPHKIELENLMLKSSKKDV